MGEPSSWKWSISISAQHCNRPLRNVRARNLRRRKIRDYRLRSEWTLFAGKLLWRAWNDTMETGLRLRANWDCTAATFTNWRAAWDCVFARHAPARGVTVKSLCGRKRNAACLMPVGFGLAQGEIARL